MVSNSFEAAQKLFGTCLIVGGVAWSGVVVFD
jgi:hypothetical protein